MVHFLSEKSTSLPTFYFSAFSFYIKFVSCFIMKEGQNLGRPRPSSATNQVGMECLRGHVHENAFPLLPRPDQAQILSALPPSGGLASDLALGLCHSQNWASGSPCAEWDCPGGSAMVSL